MSKKLLMLCFIFCLELPGRAAGTAHPVKTPRPAAKLEQNRIHSVYNEGDFDRAVALIDSFTSANKVYDREDSIFIAKHLAVIYTANPATRELGKRYMFLLLDILPSAKIVDMFVSDEIDRVFDKVKEEFLARQRSLGRAQTSQDESNTYAMDKMTVKQNAPPKAMAEPAVKSAGSSHPFYWVAGGVALVGVAGAAYYFMSQDNKPVDKTYVLP
jgi:hypothetical protein